ncbi:17300_t:CDS:2, partial [Gigaspora rosea]
RLGFNRHAVGAKQVSINAFPENMFGEAGKHRLKQLVNYDYWNIRQDPNLKTVGYGLFMDHDSSYSINFIWSQSELKENGYIFQYGTVTCKFIADSREFSDWYGIWKNQPKSQEPNPQVHDIDSRKNSLNNIELTQ